MNGWFLFLTFKTNLIESATRKKERKTYFPIFALRKKMSNFALINNKTNAIFKSNFIFFEFLSEWNKRHL